MKKTLFVFMGLLFVWGSLTGQVLGPIYEDSNGKSSINSPYGFVGLNTQNGSLRFQYFYLKSAEVINYRPKFNRFIWGFDFVGKAENGLAGLMASGTLVPSTEANFFFGMKTLFLDTVKFESGGLYPRLYGKNDDISIRDWAMIRIGLKSAEFKIFDSSKPFEDQISSVKHQAFSIAVSYNFSYAGEYIFGFSVGYEKTNNIEELKRINFSQTTTYSDATGKNVREIKKDIQVFEGTFREFSRTPISFDFIKTFTVGSEVLIALNLYGRVMVNKDYTIYRAGLGYYWLNQSDKTKIVAGFFIEDPDLKNHYGGSSRLSKRILIGLTVKYLFSGFEKPVF